MPNHSSNDPDSAQIIALAGLLQSACLVDQIARTGISPAESFNPLISSLFQFDADSPEAVYGGVHGVNLGLRIIRDILEGNTPTEHRSIIRYTLGMIVLQKKLSANTERLTIIRNRLEHTSLKAEHFTDNIQGVASSIAAIYQDTLSTFKFRIQISGSVQQLQNSQNADNIRALLLAGIRAAVLWRQMGGKRWHLLLSRPRLLKATRALIEY